MSKLTEINNSSGSKYLSKYDYCHDLGNGLFIVRESDYCGIVDQKDNIILPIIYDIIQEYQCDRILLLKDDKYGFANYEGKVIVPLSFDMVGGFTNGRTIALLDSKYYVINNDGDILSHLNYNLNGNLEIIDNEFIIFALNKLYGLIDLNNNIKILPIYNSIYYANNVLVVSIDSKHGIITLDGNEITPIKYSDIMVFYDKLFIVTENNKSGIIDNEGNTVLSLIYEEITTPYDIYDNYFLLESEASIRASHNDDFYGLLKKDGLLGLVDKKGSARTEILYTKVEKLSNNNLLVLKGDYFGIIDASGNQIVPPLYDEISNVIYKNFAVAKLNGKFGIINEFGNEILSFQYEEVGWVNEEILFGKFNNKYKLFYNSGREVTDTLFDYIEKLAIDEDSENMRCLPPRIIGKKDKYGFININGEIIVPLKYDAVEGFKHHDYSWVKMNDKFGLVYRSGKEIFACLYDSEIIYLSEDEIALVNLNGVEKIINFNGEVVGDKNIVEKFLFKTKHQESDYTYLVEDD